MSGALRWSPKVIGPVRGTTKVRLDLVSRPLVARIAPAIEVPPGP
jgi:hypothetical protein